MKSDSNYSTSHNFDTKDNKVYKHDFKLEKLAF